MKRQKSIGAVPVPGPEYIRHKPLAGYLGGSEGRPSTSLMVRMGIEFPRRNQDGIPSENGLQISDQAFLVRRHVAVRQSETQNVAASQTESCQGFLLFRLSKRTKTGCAGIRGLTVRYSYDQDGEVFAATVCNEAPRSEHLIIGMRCHDNRSLQFRLPPRRKTQSAQPFAFAGGWRDQFAPSSSRFTGVTLACESPLIRRDQLCRMQAS